MQGDADVDHISAEEQGLGRRGWNRMGIEVDVGCWVI